MGKPAITDRDATVTHAASVFRSNELAADLGLHCTEATTSALIEAQTVGSERIAKMTAFLCGGMT